MDGVSTTIEGAGTVFTEIWQTISDNIVNILVAVLMIVIFFVLAKVILDQLTRYTTKTINKAKKNPDMVKSRKIITGMTVLRSVGRYAIYFVMIALIMYQLGFGDVVSNLLVTAGIGSLAISFGAQSIIKDVFTGFFMLFEQQFSVGDFVKIGDYEGTVTSVGMRVTYLQNYKGQKIIIPNGSIENVVNYGSEYSLASVTIPTPYEADTRKVMEVIQDEINTYAAKHDDLFVEPPKAMGISDLNDSSVDILVIAKVKALNQWQVERDLRLAVKERFDKDGIIIPYQQIVVHKTTD